MVAKQKHGRPGMRPELKTCASIFSGGGGWEVGAKDVGLTPIWAIENEPRYAEAYALNHGNHVIVSDVQKVNERKLHRPDVCFVSPPCQGASQARSKSLPKRDDDEVGLESIRIISHLLPSVVFMENVVPYRLRPVCWRIVADLSRLGYALKALTVNAANYGVPQTRLRLLIIAVLDRPLPVLPVAPPANERCNWLNAICDLKLPESPFAPWQWARGIPEERDIFVGGQNSRSKGVRIWRESNEPGFTITKSMYKAKHRVRINGGVYGLNARGCARIQSFPDSYKLVDEDRSYSVSYEVIGNAVPPKMSKALCKEVMHK